MSILCESKGCANDNKVKAVYTTVSGLSVCEPCYNRLAESRVYHKQVRQAEKVQEMTIDILITERIEIIRDCQSLSIEDIRYILSRGEY